MQTAAEIAGMVLAAFVAWMRSRGVKITPHQIADKAGKYVKVNAEALRESADKYLQEFQEGHEPPAPTGGGSHGLG
jgi:hypothetical protein